MSQMERENGLDWFRNGRRAVDAVKEIVNRIRMNKGEGRHSLVMSLDLENAFNSAWGPAVVNGLREKGVNEKWVRLVRNFLEERMIRVGNEWRVVDRGCPQGSCVGPTLWITLMETWFRKMGRMRDMNGWAQAYADDQVVIISANSVKKIESEWERVWGECMEWATENKMSYKVKKTQVMFVRAGKQIREPVVRMGSEKVELSESVMYFGVVIDRMTNWGEHMLYVRKKIQKVASKFVNLGRRKWGKRMEILKILYERVVVPMVMCGAEIWGEKAGTERMQKALRAVERPYLRAMTGGYRTAPTAAFAVIAGYVPLEVRARTLYEAEQIFRREILK